ncbi:MAG: hypothetical protein R3E35_10480 [Rhodocyclaceae bacterium]
MKYFIAFVAAAMVPLLAWPHGGEDHSHDAAPVMATDIAQRVAAQTEEFELLAVKEDKMLILYLDRFTSNEPVAGAQIEVESGSFKATAAQVAPGVYSLSGEAFAEPGKYPLTISVQAGDSADLLTATLDLAPPAVGVAHARGWDTWAVWSASGTLLLVGAGLVAVRRRKQNRKH